ncbi:MAG: tetratricopeptide repeat protein [Tsuneonella sp.]
MLPVILPLLLQVGPAPGASDALQLPPEIVDHRSMERAASQATPQPAASQPPLLNACVSALRGDPAAAIDFAEARLAAASGLELAQLQQCRGMALSATGDFAEAADAFVAAREAAPANEATYRARLGAMAGNAALAAGNAEAALAELDAAIADAGPDGGLAGEMALDRGRALVALGRNAEAAKALEAARLAAPGDPQAWLLSATLSRRMGDLAAAQSQIEKAAELDPRDRSIGLEAGVIAVLSGRDDAARKSWQSVIDAKPDSEEAATARGYIAQLGGKANP